MEYIEDHSVFIVNNRSTRSSLIRVTLIFISGRGSATSFVKQGKSESCYNLVENK